MKLNKRGMTILEVIIAIAIVSVIIGVTYSVYIGSSKHIWKIELDTQLQNEAKVIESTFSQLSMQTKGVDSITLNTDGLENVSELVMKTSEDTFKWMVDERKLILNIGEDDNSKSYILSENIEIFKIKPIDKSSIEDAKIIQVDIVLGKKKGFNDIEHPISMIVTFRNK